MSFFHITMKRYSLAMALLGMCPALMASECAKEKAESQLEYLSEALDIRIKQESGPVRLQKDKIGFVLVARAAPIPTNLVALATELNALTDMLDEQPEKVCSNAERLRQKYRL